jgi:hypothetical protein
MKKVIQTLHWREGSLPVRRILRVFFLLMALTGSWGCTNEDDPGPTGDIPPEMEGQWLKGTFNMTNFWSYDGQDLGKGYESSRALTFTKEGRVEMYLYFHIFDGYCHSHAFTYIKGIAVADGDKLTITALSGKYRGAYGGYCGSSRKNFERDMTKEEVEKSVYKFYWEREKRNGKEFLVLRHNRKDEDSASDFYRKSQW